MMDAYQHVQVLPKVLSHETEKSKKCPAEAVKAGIAVVWIASSLHTCVAFRTTSNQRHTKHASKLQDSLQQKGFFTYKAGLPGYLGSSLEHI